MRIAIRMRIGSLQLNSNLILAPMSGITDYPFRQLVMIHGCGLVFTEMVSAEGLLRKGKSFLKIEKDGHPISVQLFGSSPEILAEASIMVEDAGADAIDINMGCPAKQVAEAGAGVDLMRFPEKITRILSRVRKIIRIPLTIKIRSGWDREKINAVQISKIGEDCGVDAIIIHPRTKVQGFRGRADWNLIREVKRSTNILVVGNGDVTTRLLAKKMMDETNCDGVMVGRGALGNPWIFDQGESVLYPTLKERDNVIKHHFLLLQNYYGERGAMREIRKHMVWYTKGLPLSASFRSKLQKIRETKELFETLTFYFQNLYNSNEGYATCLPSSGGRV
jgi:tRNA-dihydrouridine synthase B